MIVVKKASDSPCALSWTKEKEHIVFMKRCACKGLIKSVYENMGWDEDFKYRIVGSVSHHKNETLLSFYLGDPIIIAPIHHASADKGDEVKRKVKTKQGIRDGYDADEDFIVEVNTGSYSSDILEPIEDDKSSRSRAIYYDDGREGKMENVTLEAMKDKKYSPKYLQLMLQQNIAPVEGWCYLRGMGKIYPGSLMIYPTEWENSFGHNCLENGITKLFLDGNKTSQVKPLYYGWTVGLDLPTKETVREAINSLRTEIA